MDLHEYQAAELFRKAGMAVNSGEVAESSREAEAACERLGGRVVVKAQVHSGGRGKAGGVKLAHSPGEAARRADEILGMSIHGHVVRKVLVSPLVEIESESYVAALVDRAAGGPAFIVSREGGVDIEQVAAENPSAIHRLAVDPRYGLLPHQAYWLARRLYDEGDLVRQGTRVMLQLYRALVENGAQLAEINPLIVASDGKVVAIDAKVSIDDNALPGKPDIARLRDSSAEVGAEAMAREASLSFVKLDGDVGCCVNGAGLAMATMDLVQYYGGRPANFLDIGGSSNPDKVVAALRIISEDPGVRVILFNIFGGITRCDDVALGILAAVERLGLDKPMFIRLTGSNEEAALRMLRDAGYSVSSTMDEVVESAVEAAAA